MLRLFRKKPSKKHFFLPFALMGFILVLTFIFLTQPTKQEESLVELPVDVDIEKLSKKRHTICEEEENISYFYYKESTQNPKNNKFGLYIYAEQREFFELAQNLVNSNGGDWGYVLIPYNVSTDRDYAKWRGVFDRLYNKHLIPIIQLWTLDASNYEKETKEAAEFLNRFVWPIRQRYVSVYNEPNDSKFWNGNVNPGEYARVLNHTIDAFKDVNPNFFMLNGAFNISAPTDFSHVEALSYMYLMNQEVPGVFENLDGWASHSYPQPNFSGNPDAVGRWSIKAYEEELRYLEDVLGVKKDLPVFITETGWAHAEGESYNPSYLSADQVAKNLKYAYEKVWLKDERVVAVTPFTIWYEPPFDHFSWVNRDNVFYKQYDVIKKMRKVSGTPEHLMQDVITSTVCE